MFKLNGTRGKHRKTKMHKNKSKKLNAVVEINMVHRIQRNN